MAATSLGLLETTGLTPALVALDALCKAADVTVAQIELNDLCGVCVKIQGSAAAVRAALEVGQTVAEQMQGHPVTTLISRLDEAAGKVVFSKPEYSPLIEQPVVFSPADGSESSPGLSAPRSSDAAMNTETPLALGFIETQGFTAVFEAIDTACKTAAVEVVGKEKLGGGYVTVVVKGELSAVTAAVEAGKAHVEGLGKLIAAHVIARPVASVLALLPKV